mmetsp:Transcript_20161/g.35835  ORF Transcript_20161/g.35835 Transcript_20161/m.35835 type:complete len:500 (-) Transcript_20161:2244-3743(-)
MTDEDCRVLVLREVVEKAFHLCQGLSAQRLFAGDEGWRVPEAEASNMHQGLNVFVEATVVLENRSGVDGSSCQVRTNCIRAIQGACPIWWVCRDLEPRYQLFFARSLLKSNNFFYLHATRASCAVKQGRTATRTSAFTSGISILAPWHPKLVQPSLVGGVKADLTIGKLNDDFVAAAFRLPDGHLVEFASISWQAHVANVQTKILTPLLGCCKEHWLFQVGADLLPTPCPERAVVSFVANALLPTGQLAVTPVGPIAPEVASFGKHRRPRGRCIFTGNEFVFHPASGRVRATFAAGSSSNFLLGIHALHLRATATFTMIRCLPIVEEQVHARGRHIFVVACADMKDSNSMRLAFGSVAWKRPVQLDCQIEAARQSFAWRQAQGLVQPGGFTDVELLKPLVGVGVPEKLELRACPEVSVLWQIRAKRVAITQEALIEVWLWIDIMPVSLHLHGIDVVVAVNFLHVGPLWLLIKACEDPGEVHDMLVAVCWNAFVLRVQLS